MNNQFSRSQLLLGTDAMEKLKSARVAVFGIGGVGGYTAEALARCGVGQLDIVDDDKVSLTNLNRQIIALHSTLGMDKVDVMFNRLKDINPDIIVNRYKCFYLPETSDCFDFTQYSYVVDAVDTVAAKLDIIVRSKKLGIPVISAMGAGNKLSPAMLEVSDIYKTSVCPLARVMRTELRKRGVDSLKVVYSKEPPVKVNPENITYEPECSSRRSIPGSVSFVPSVAGLIIASEVIKDIAGINN